MSRIHLLSPQVAAQIAAGEVITRPAAVVKELVENALDADSTVIRVELEEGGRRRLRVVDDGCGMTPAEAELALQRHATSKIRAESDLLAVTTLGFRGEALPSIATVSRLTLITRPPEAQGGWRLVVEGGEVQESSVWPAPVGTQVTVADLFFNTPVRRKFLKSRESEQASVVEMLRHLALGFPAVHFLVQSAGRTLLSAPAPQTLPERAAALYGPEVAGHLLPVSAASGSLSVSGLISEPDFSLATSRLQVLLVNRRAVQDRLLGAVLKTVYQGLLPRGRHPAALLHLTLPPAEVDVNIHPAKAEIRLHEAGRVYALLVAALRQSLGGLAPGGPRYTVSLVPMPPAQVQEAAEAAVSPRPQPSSPAPRCPSPPPLFHRHWRFADLLIIGQLNNTYILAQAPEGLILIDQHAAHERILFESLSEPSQGGPRQGLLLPQVVEVKPQEAEWLRANLSLLLEWGLEVEPFGGASFLVRAVPACLAGAEVAALLLEMVDRLAPLQKQGDSPRVREAARMLMACHGAIRAGESLSREEIQALLNQLDGLSISSHCPHGRPLWRLIPLADIRRSFRRPRD